MKEISYPTKKEKIKAILEGKTIQVGLFSKEIEESDILMFPLCFEKPCCFYGEHQLNIGKAVFDDIQFPYHCKDNYGRNLTIRTPEDIGISEDKWNFPEFNKKTPLISPLSLPLSINKFNILDAGCSFVKCFLEFYNWDMQKVNFSYISNFSSSLFPRLLSLIKKVKKWGFDAIFLEDEFGYRSPWFPVEFFKKELLSFYIRLAVEIHKEGLYFFLHSCGHAEEIFYLLKNYVDVWHRGDWEDLQTIYELVNNEKLPIIFVDATEIPLNLPEKVHFSRGAIITSK